MGTPLPDNEPTTGCALCFGSGGVLGEVQPRYVNLFFSDVAPGKAIDQANAFIPHGRFRLTHRFDCLYLHRGATFDIRLDWAATRTRVFLESSGFFDSTWFSAVGVLCATSIIGNSENEKDRMAIDGLVTISWSQDGL